MITPRWVGTRCQPISIHDVLDYLVAAAARPEVTGIVEIGGPDVLSYGGVMMAYARLRGLRRLMIPVPVLTPRLSSYWVNLVSPVPAAIARPLIEGLRNEVVVRDPGPAAAFGLTPLSLDEALRRAIDRTDRHAVESTWFDAYAGTDRDSLPASSSREGMIVDRRAVVVAASPERVFAEVERVGGATGWPYANKLWRMRGVVDRVVGGVGMRLGRRDPDHVRVGDAVDFWRVEAVREPELLRLRAEMRLPGRAWLQFELESSADGRRTRLVQTAFFEPRGLAGLAYWYGFWLCTRRSSRAWSASSPRGRPPPRPDHRSAQGAGTRGDTTGRARRGSAFAEAVPACSEGAAGPGATRQDRKPDHQQREQASRSCTRDPHRQPAGIPGPRRASPAPDRPDGDRSPGYPWSSRGRGRRGRRPGGDPAGGRGGGPRRVVGRGARRR